MNGEKSFGIQVSNCIGRHADSPQTQTQEGFHGLARTAELSQGDYILSSKSLKAIVEQKPETLPLNDLKHQRARSRKSCNLCSILIWEWEISPRVFTRWHLPVRFWGSG
jgi:hypothetical protein